MKNYNEIADELFERRDIYLAERRKKRKHIITATVCAICVLSIATGAGVWYKSDRPALKPNSNIITGTADTISHKLNDRKIITSCKTTSGASCYAAPQNGAVINSMEVCPAAEEISGKENQAAFLVRIDIFKDGKIPSDDEIMSEHKRLNALGYKFYTVSVWEYEGEEANKVYRDEILALVDGEKINSFDINPDYGYFIDFEHNGDGSAIDFSIAKPLDL